MSKVMFKIEVEYEDDEEYTDVLNALNSIGASIIEEKDI